MHSYDSPYLADWFAISLRWLAVLGITVSLALAGQLSLECQVVLLIIAVWNALQSILAVLNRRLPAHRLINILVDSLVACALYWLAGGFYGSVWWVGLLPLLAASIYYELRGSLLVSLLLTAGLTGMSSLDPGLPASLVPVALVGVVNLLSGLILGMLSRQVIRGLRTNRGKQIQLKKEADERAQQVDRERMQAFYNLTATLSGTLNYQRVMDTALDLSVSALAELNSSANLLTSAVLLCREVGMEVGSGRGLTASDLRASLPGSAGAIGQAMNSADSIHCPDPTLDPELSRLVGLRGSHSALIIPLRSGLNVYGVMLYGHPNADYFSPTRQEILEIIAHQTVSAIQNARLYQDLEAEKQRIIETQEEARKKLARDLHDGPTQSLSAIAMRVNYTRKLLERDTQAAAEELLKIEDMARRTTKEIRHMLFTLRPLALETEGLTAALHMMADRMKETFDQNVIVDLDEALVGELEANKQTVVFYISEEAISNARKHAQAAHICVRLKPVPQAPEVALLEIIDDGVGFDYKAVRGNYERRGSLGMVNLEERTELVNGLLHIDSKPGKGTRVQVYLPLTEAAADRLHRGK